MGCQNDHGQSKRSLQPLVLQPIYVSATHYFTGRRPLSMNGNSISLGLTHSALAMSLLRLRYGIDTFSD